jgi:5'-deoxynucleotidase YfbR-like HD superfamily hydrolase
MMGRIVLISKHVMDKWRLEQEDLRDQMVKQAEKLDLYIKKENFKYVERINELEKLKQKRLDELNAEYEKVQMEEAEQKDEN